MNPRIEINPEIMTGKPVIRGTRIPVYLILDLLAEGRTTAEIIKAYPDLKKDDIEAALHFAGHLARFEEEQLVGS
ncbi:MAG: DUF433 domain-containing protein [Candidatus Margulisiibacteriota bacterium]